MLSKFFRENYLKLSQDCVHYLHKKRKYDCDILNSNNLQKLESAIKDFTHFTKQKLSQDQGHAELLKLTQRYEVFFQAEKNRSWKENVEVIFVALVIALAVKAYFFQPFRIPTHSMRPSLLGILSERREGDKPPFYKQIGDFILKGRSYHRIIAQNGGVITSITEQKMALFLTVTQITVGSDTYKIWASLSELKNAGYGLLPEDPTSNSLAIGTKVRAGQELVNFEVEMGDYVFVNKMTYHFRLPERGEVFVFTTRNILGIPQNGLTSEGSQYYIKRCVGVGGDTLKIQPPYLYNQNGILKPNASLEKIYSMKNGYGGYTLAVGSQAQWLTTSESTLTIPEESYWAMGDNSAHSFDSRYWGPVPRENLVGTGFLVAWPFTSRWGFIR